MQQPWSYNDEEFPLDPWVLCIGLALHELIDYLPTDHEFTVAVDVIVREAEAYRPDLLELTWAWDSALAVLTRMIEAGRAGALAIVLLEQLEDRPF